MRDTEAELGDCGFPDTSNCRLSEGEKCATHGPVSVDEFLEIHLDDLPRGPVTPRRCLGFDCSTQPMPNDEYCYVCGIKARATMAERFRISESLQAIFESWSERHPCSRDTQWHVLNFICDVKHSIYKPQERVNSE